MASKKTKKSSAGRSTAKKMRAPAQKVAKAKTVAKKAAKKTAKKSAAQKVSPKGAKKAVAKKAPTKKASERKASQKKVAKKTTAKKVAPRKTSKKALSQAAKGPSAAQKARERERAQKEKERQKKALAREREQARKEKELQKKEKEREKLRLQKEKELQKKEKEREAERLSKEKEREKERLLKEKEREKERLLKEKERQLKEKEREKERLLKEKERLRKEKEREAERLRKEKERERVRLLKEKEKERLLKEKEQEAYRKAREAERERVRAEKEAARRALEGRVAQQARHAQRIAGTGRGGSNRVYRPDAIPSQAGTRREGLDQPRFTGAAVAKSTFVRPSTTAPPPRPAPPDALDERWALIQKRLKGRPEKFQREYAESFDMSWIHHDSALEGVVYTYQELKTAVDPNITIVPDSSLQPVCEEIRRHKKALEWARELGESDAPLSAEILKRLLLLLHPEEGDLKSVKYRKEIPQHRLYFHDYAPPDKIAVRIRQAFDWLHGPEPPKLKDPIRVAARLHYDLLRTFPFPQDSGKVARLSMNILLMRAGLPPVIIHSTERQRYYDALRGSLPTIVQMVNDSMRNAMASIEKVLDDEEEEEKK